MGSGVVPAFPIEVCTDEQRGRYMVVTSQVKAGAVILSQRPYASVPNSADVCDRCAPKGVYRHVRMHVRASVCVLACMFCAYTRTHTPVCINASTCACVSEIKNFCLHSASVCWNDRCFKPSSCLRCGKCKLAR
jgi:hypothetical protein